jgi:AmmeMemoRadiSam system protein B/AmmeMemoRadiSam system protein A
MIKKRKKKTKILKYKNHLVLIIIICIFLLIIFSNKTSDNQVEIEKNIRSPKFSGTWYPGSKSSLSNNIDDYFDNVKKQDIGNINALIVPHAGYTYSGQVAAHGFYQLQDKYNKVFIIGSNHNANAPYFTFSVPNYTHYKTPLGEVRVSEITRDLLKNDLFENVKEAHETHIVEIELPFLQKKLSDFEIIPIVTGNTNFNDLKKACELISKYIDEQTLIVISSDLSHYHTYDQAVSLDTECIKNIENQDIDNVKNCEACGLSAILILLEISKSKNWKAKIIEYKNSGDVSGDKSRVVGYSSIVFYEEDISEKDKEFLIELSRKTLETYVKEKKKPNVNKELISERLLNKQGCFVTLNKNGNLRGCIGHIIPQESLYECVIENTINAAVNDRRFSQVQENELDDIEIEISALSVPEELHYESPEDLLNKLVPLKHGVILKSGFQQSTYLPQVWEQLPDKETFLSRLCIKAGISEECWKNSNTKVLTYTANVWYEN